MTDLFKAMNENKRAAVSFLKTVKDNMIEFVYDDFNEPPCVLISDDDGCIEDLAVTEARLDEHEEIEFYIEALGEWMHGSECLSTTANNVYEHIEKSIFG